MNRASPTKKDLRALRDKYERMFSLRMAHARARADATFIEPDPRAEMTKLAAEFPGSLREIDLLPLEVIEARIDAIRRAERAATRVERWMVAQVVFHRHARGALAVKRWLAGRKTITSAVREAFERWTRTLPREDAVWLFAESLEVVARPPGGRLMHLVHERTARVLDVSVAQVRLLVFGIEPPR